MSSLIADKAVEALLGTVSEQAEIRDLQGRLLGYFTPVKAANSEFIEYIKSQYNPEEMRRIKERGWSGYTTQEVLDHLKSLETP